MVTGMAARAGRWEYTSEPQELRRKGTGNVIRLLMSNPTCNDLFPPQRLYYIKQPDSITSGQQSVPIPGTTEEIFYSYFYSTLGSPQLFPFYFHITYTIYTYTYLSIYVLSLYKI